MKQVLPIELVNGHIIVTIDGQRALLDTGSPTSIGRTHRLALLDQDYELEDEFLGIDIDGLVELSGVDFDALLGADILQEMVFTLDVRAKEMRVSLEDMEYTGESVPLSSILDIPVVETDLQGESIRCVIDTGAQISYVDKRHTRNLTPVDEVEDFYPGLGRFKVSVFEIPIRLGTLSMTLKAGNLPGELESLLSMVKAQAILGTEIFLHTSAMLNLRRGVLLMQNHGTH